LRTKLEVGPPEISYGTSKISGTTATGDENKLSEDLKEEDERAGSHGNGNDDLPVSDIYDEHEQEEATVSTAKAIDLRHVGGG
jgi:hypothetical protein